MTIQTPTDALRLVPIDMQIESILHDLVEEVSAAQRGARVKARARQCCARGAAKNALLNLLAAAPASPLPGGGDMDWQDRAEGLESDLRQAVLVAWKRGAEEWCRLNYPQWVEWLEACHAPAAPTGEPK